jgi:hypothetical protein
MPSDCEKDFWFYIQWNTLVELCTFIVCLYGGVTNEMMQNAELYSGGCKPSRNDTSVKCTSSRIILKWILDK